MNKGSELERGLINELSSGLKERLFSGSGVPVDLVGIYEAIGSNYSEENPGDFLPELEISQCSLEPLLLTKHNIRNIGIDLPIWFGKFLDAETRIMIVAMDPKRNGQAHNRITLNTVFSLHSMKHGRSTARNDYWKFIQPMTERSFVYVTDAYKVYYEYDEEIKGRHLPRLSNKDKGYVGMSSIAREMNRSIIQWEFDIIKPSYVVALGNDAAFAVRSLRGIKGNDMVVEDGSTKYLFMPHISRTVTQSIVTVGNLFSALGMLKQDDEMVRVGDSIKTLRKSLFH